MSDVYRYHGLGNDYLVMEPARWRALPGPEGIVALCDRHRGVGSDGLLWGPLPGETAASGFTVRIFNPDGSETEKSGNGVRIFARHAWEHHSAGTEAFSIHTLGGETRAQVLSVDGNRFRVAMGQVRFTSQAIPVAGPPREVLREALEVAGETLQINAATIGNPHCVVPVEQPTPELARRLGPLLERHALFPNRTNVQFLRPLDVHRIQIEIWERGAGYTLASGSSSCAAAAVAVRLGLCQSPVTVQMPGGTLEIRLDADFHAELEGDVRSVYGATLTDAFLRETGFQRA